MSYFPQAQAGLHTDTAGKTLPMGWERYETSYGVAYYVDHVTEVTSWESPVLATNQPVAVNANGDHEDAIPLLGRKQRESAELVKGEKGSEVLRDWQRVEQRTKGEQKQKGSFLERARKQKVKGEVRKMGREEGKREDVVFVDGVGWVPKGWEKGNYLVNHS